MASVRTKSPYRSTRRWAAMWFALTVTPYVGSGQREKGVDRSTVGINRGSLDYRSFSGPTPPRHLHSSPRARAHPEAPAPGPVAPAGLVVRAGGVRRPP